MTNDLMIELFLFLLFVSPVLIILFFLIKYIIVGFRKKRWLLFSIHSVMVFVIFVLLAKEVFKESKYYSEMYITQRILAFPLPQDYEVLKRELDRSLVTSDYVVKYVIKLHADSQEEFMHKIHQVDNPRGYWKDSDSNSTKLEFIRTNYGNDVEYFDNIYMSFDKTSGLLDFSLSNY